MNLNERISHFI